MGGEITWVCDKDPLSPNYGQYTFTLKIYQDCDGISFTYFDEFLTVHNNPAITQITMPFLDTNDISPSGIAGSETCYDCDNQPFGTFGAVREWIYQSAPTTITGTPPVGGWHFTWGSCCRSSNITNGFSDEDWTLRAVMYPYTDPTGNVLPSGNMCHDNSPIFKEQAKSILCTGYPFSYSHLAFDSELDSISYSWAEPLGDEFSYDPNNPIGIALAFDPPYSVNSPIPGLPTLNPNNGEISFLSNTAGVFVTCVKVSAFKCGQLVADVFREVQVMLKSCGTLPNGAQNSPPVITEPIGPQDWITAFNPNTGLPSYETTVMAGEVVSFSVVATDNDINATGNLQDLNLEVEGGQLDPALAISSQATFTVTSSAPGNISGDFYWESDCDHMQDFGCGRQGGAFTFNLKAYDDFCPANGIVIATITINIIPPQPDLRCISVEDNGDSKLDFYFPPGVVDSNIRYFVYHSDQYSGPYDLIDSVYFPDTTYIHSNANADDIINYYFLVGSVSCGSNLGGSDSLLYSDTLSSIFMQADPINLGITADLSWNQIIDPLLITSDIDYNLHYINSNGYDSIISILPDLNYEFDGDNCDYYPEFYVEIFDERGCKSRSSIGVVHLEDTITSITPKIESVSVTNEGKAIINWSDSPDSDIYIIYKKDSYGAWITLDTILYGVNSYTYENSESTSLIEEFSVRALDSCGNTRSRSLFHNTMLISYTANVCEYTIMLDWNDYLNWDNGVSHYKVFITETDPDGVVSISQIRVSSSTNFLFDDITSSSDYSIYVEAYNEDSSFTARSNALDINIVLPQKADYNYLEYATIDHTSDNVEINCIVDNEAVIERYDIYRSQILDSIDNEITINYTKIDEVDFNGSSNITYVDDDADINNISYRYKILPVDTCGVTQVPPPYNSSLHSGDWYAQTILLSVKKNINYVNTPLEGEFTNTIMFNEYEKWLGGVSRYELYRSVNGDSFSMLPIMEWNRTTNPDQDLIFVDRVTNEGKGNGRFCYYVKAIEGLNTPYGPLSDGVYSNIFCVNQTPVVYLPNTFTPNDDNHNELFMPITYFISEEGYSFSIFNRQGSEIFYSENPLKGWDGTYKGKQVQNGKYVYYFKYINGDNELIEKTGLVNLVR